MCKLKNEKGQGIIEYVLIIVLISIVTIAALILLVPHMSVVTAFFSTIILSPWLGVVAVVLAIVMIVRIKLVNNANEEKGPDKEDSDSEEK